MSELVVLLAIEAALFVAIIVLREPKLLIPAVVIGLPFEYLQTQTLDQLGEGGAGGAIRAMLNPGKAAMAATVVVAVVRCRHNPGRLFPDSAILLPLAALLAVVALGVFWSDSRIPPNAVLIMPLYVAFVFVAPSLIEDRRDLERIVGAILLVAAVLSSLAVAQRLFGVFNWRTILIQSDAYSYRSNATFADPNNFARYLSIAMALAAGLILTTGPRRQTVWLALPMLGVSAMGIVATASRSGWIALILVTFLVVMMAPIARYTKFRLVAMSAGGLAVMITLLLLQGGTDAERVKSLTSGVTLLGQRSFLIRAGWEMWKDSPLIGVGSGNYQNSLIMSYLWAIPSWAEVSLSHTSVISILAELGIVGISLFVLVLTRIAVAITRAYHATRDRYNRLLIGWCAAALIGILFQSQSEGRLLDEPYLWLVLAVFVALETRFALRVPETETVAARAEETSSVPAVPVSRPVRKPGAPVLTSELE